MTKENILANSVILFYYLFLPSPSLIHLNLFLSHDLSDHLEMEQVTGAVGISHMTVNNDSKVTSSSVTN